MEPPRKRARHGDEIESEIESEIEREDESEIESDEDSESEDEIESEDESKGESEDGSEDESEVGNDDDDDDNDGAATAKRAATAHLRCKSCRFSYFKQQCANQMCGRCCAQAQSAAAKSCKHCPFHIAERVQARAQCAALLKIARADYTKEDASRSKKTALAKGSCHEVALHHVGESVTVFCFSDWLKVPAHSASTLELQRQRARRNRKRRRSQAQ